MQQWCNHFAVNVITTLIDAYADRAFQKSPFSKLRSRQVRGADLDSSFLICIQAGCKQTEL